MISIRPYQMTTPLDDRAKERWISPMFGALNFIFKMAHGLDDQFARLVYTDEELLAHIHNKLAWFDPILRREQYLIGRFWNRLMRERTEEIILAGIMIKQLHDLAGKTVPDGLKFNMRYLVHHSDVRILRERAERTLKGM